jgi:hypothetical protein
MIEGYRGVKNRNYLELDTGHVDFGIRDQKGRAIGYRWRIYSVTTEVMPDEEYAATRFCGLIKDGAPLDYVELRTTTTRDGVGYGPSTPPVQVDTVEAAHQTAASRTEAARKSNTKKFAAFNKEVA